MRESELETHIHAICTDLDVIYIHYGRSVQVVKGVPDDILIGHHGILYRENKTVKGRLSQAQDRIIGRLRVAGADVDVWSPQDLLSGRIAMEIAAISRLGPRIAARQAATGASCG